jgi:hypothetical protein
MEDTLLFRVFLDITLSGSFPPEGRVNYVARILSLHSSYGRVFRVLFIEWIDYVKAIRLAVEWIVVSTSINAFKTFSAF